MKKVLLHICCGVCAFSCIEKLRKEEFCLEGFFFNPNIYPYQEYRKRREALKAAEEILSIRVSEGRYENSAWISYCKLYSAEPEGGKRCEKCFEIRLQETFRLMQKKNFDYFTTTLTISPHKNSFLINKIGERIGGERFLQRDFKKKDGFKQTQELSKRYGLYRQNYCGCVYSMEKKTDSRHQR